MPTRRYLQLDVFADRPGAGNPLGVVVDTRNVASADSDDKGLDSAAMQALAAWTNLSETIFLLPARDPGADYRVRIFTPRRELPFAGHPSVGAAWAALETGLAKAHEHTLVQECGAGLLPVRVESRGADRMIHVRAPRARQLPEVASHAPLLEAVLDGMPRDRAAHALQSASLWDNGPRWWLVELEDATAVRTLHPDLPAIAALSCASDAVGLAVYGRASAPDHQLVVRAFCPSDNIPEDPVTGSANAAIAACLAQAGALPGQDGRYVASQGRELGRDGRVLVQVDDEGEVWIGGQVQPVIEGRLRWGDADPDHDKPGQEIRS